MKNLFDSTNMGPMILKNRFIRAATGDRFAKNGHIAAADFPIYEKLAESGVGTIITGYAYVADHPNSPGMFGIYDDSFIKEYQKLTEMVHHFGVNIFLQLVYCGSRTRVAVTDRKVWGPSAVENLDSKIMPREMTEKEIHQVQQAFADAALRAQRAGFDGVELHAAHGFLLNQFLTPYYNRRTDEYGGSDENRARMLLETYRLVREKVGSNYPVWVKINCNDGIEQGITPSGFQSACEQLSHSGVDAIELSGPWFHYKAKDEFYFKEYAAQIAATIKSPVILTGGNRDYEAMNAVLNTTSIAYFGLSRPFIAEPDLVKRWACGDTHRTKCISCNGCLGSGRCVRSSVA